MLRSLLFVVLSLASYDCAIIPDLADLGNVGGFREMMRNMRSRMTNRESGRMSLINSLDLTNLSKMKIPPAVMAMVTGERMFQPVNLANIKFDASSDKAYRMGNWYVIRRRSKNKEEVVDDWSDFFDNNDNQWEVVRNGVQQVSDVATTGCALSGTATKTARSKKDSEDSEELSAEVLNQTL